MFSQMDFLTVVVSVFAGSSVVLITGLNLYFKIRRKYPITVNCWFCNSNAKVPYESRNSWECSSCEQYNGFSADGDYNKTIPAQHDESLNNPVTSRQEKMPPKTSSNGLCWKCNCNQELKIYQLASFSPINPTKYDEELESFRKRLEKEYKLCNLCEGRLKKILNQQKDWLLSLNFESIRNKILSPQKNIIPKVNYTSRWYMKFGPGILRNLLVLVSGWICLAHGIEYANGASPYISYIRDMIPHYIQPLLPLTLEWEIIFAGVAVFMHFIAALTSWHKNPCKKGCSFAVAVDSICCISWLCLQTLSWLSEPDTIEWATKQFDAAWLKTTKVQSYLVVVSYLTLFFQAISALTPRTPHLTKKTLKESSFLRLNTQKKTRRTYSGEYSDDENECVQKKSLPTKQGVSSPLLDYSDTMKSSKVDDEDLDIGNLSLGPIKTANYAKVGHQPPNSFINRVKPLIQPAKLNLKNIVQSSWVAGGYWQVPNSYQYQFSAPKNNQIPSLYTNSGGTFFPYNGSPLSRSSSQSSGFVSHAGTGSNVPVYASASLPGSRSSSTCGDQENGSVFSEPMYKYQSPQYYGNIFSGNHCQSSFPQTHPLYRMVSSPVPSLYPQYPTYYGREPHINHCCCCQSLPLKPNLNLKSVAEDSDSHSSSSSGFAESLSGMKSTKANRQGSVHKVNSHKSSDCKSKERWSGFNIWSILWENVFLLVICGSSLIFNVLMFYLLYTGQSNWFLAS